MSIKVTGLRKKYGSGKISAEILKGIDFEIKDGEILTVLGPSGSGKSTLLNLLGGLDSADSGSIEINGTDITKLSVKELTAFRRNNFGFIYQFYNLVSDLNVYENVEVCHWLGDKSTDIKAMLESVNMWEHKNKFPDELSGGMQQRVSIARALSKNPKILFCDEPTGALDYKSAHDVLNVIENVHKKSNTTVILVTHNRAIADMSDHVIEIKDGKVALDTHNANPLSAKEVEW
jgi:putative ABC transport system ATP-binding protein